MSGVGSTEPPGGVGSTEPPKSAEAAATPAPAQDPRGGADFAGAPDRQLARKNVIWGVMLFGVMLALALGTVGVALIYLALD